MRRIPCTPPVLLIGLVYCPVKIFFAAHSALTSLLTSYMKMSLGSQQRYFPERILYNGFHLL